MECRGESWERIVTSHGGARNKRVALPCVFEAIQIIWVAALLPFDSTPRFHLSKLAVAHCTLDIFNTKRYAVYVIRIVITRVT
jgi:hypothetical protein